MVRKTPKYKQRCDLAHLGRVPAASTTRYPGPAGGVMIPGIYVAAIARLPRPGPPPAPLGRPRPVTPAPRGARARWLPAAAWAATILVATSWPNPDVPAVGGGDKLVHAGLYAGLAWLVARASQAGHRAASLAWVFAGVAAFGAADEWHQQFIPGRSTSAADWAADLTGAALGTAAAAAAAARRAAPRA